MRKTLLAVFLSLLLFEVSSSEDNFESEEWEFVTGTSAYLDSVKYTTPDEAPIVSSTEEVVTENIRRYEVPSEAGDLPDTSYIYGGILLRMGMAEEYIMVNSRDKRVMKDLPKYSFLFASLVYFLMLGDPLLTRIILSKMSDVEPPMDFDVDSLFDKLKFPADEVSQMFRHLAQEKTITMPIIVEQHILDLAEKYKIGESAINSGDVDVIGWLFKRGAIRPEDIRSSKGLAERILESSDARQFLGNMTIFELSEIIHEEESGLRLLSKLGRIDVFETMFQYGFNTSGVDKFNKTALEYGVEQGNVDLVKYFVSKGVSLTGRYSNGDSLLHIAALNGKKEMVEYLLGQGLSPDSMNFRGQTPWYSAASRRHEEIVKIMLKFGADLFVKNRYYDSQLHVAAQFGDVNATEVLIDFGIDVDIENFGMTPLYRAAQFGKSNIIKILMDKYANIEHGRYNRNKLIHIAARNNHDQVVKTLIELGVNVNSLGSWEFTALHWAGRVGFTKVMQVLLDKGADIEARIDIGRTPLHEAAFWGQVEPCRLLIANGANIMATDNSGRWPSQLAKASDHNALYLMLKNLEK